VKTILQFGALNHIPRDGSISADELAPIVGADREVLSRSLPHRILIVRAKIPQRGY
jgi:hypothetical protein